MNPELCMPNTSSALAGGAESGTPMLNVHVPYLSVQAAARPHDPAKMLNERDGIPMKQAQRMAKRYLKYNNSKGKA